MHVLAIVLASILAVALVGYVIWKEVQASRRERAREENLRQRLAAIDRSEQRALDALASWRRELHEEDAAWEASASQQMIQGIKKS